MRILMVNDYSDSIGGTETYLEMLENHLKARGHIVSVFTSDISAKEYKENLHKKGLIKFLNKIFSIKYYLKFRKFVKEFNPDVIHMHNILYELSPSVLLAAKAYPIILSVHDTSIIMPVPVQTLRTGKPCKNSICSGCTNCIGLKGLVFEIVKNKIHKRIYSYVDLFIGNSDFVNKLLSQKFNNVLRIPFGVKLFPYSSMRYSGNILFVGRIVKEKGIYSLAEAFKSIVDENPKCYLTVLGDGSEKESFMKYIQTHKIRNIIFKKPISQKNLKEYYEKNDLLVIPSIWDEAFGNVGVEAMSVGRPVVGSNVGGIPDWLKDGVNGYLVKPNDSKELAHKVNELLLDKNRLEKFGNNARKMSLRFDISIHVDKLEKEYLKFVKNKITD